MSCANCNAEATGSYCSSCGQRTDVRQLAIAHLLRRSFGELTSFDRPLWRTVRDLMLRPGVVAADYARGRRVCYTNPIKWALATTTLAFLGNRLVGARGVVRFDVEGTLDMPAWARPVFDSLASNAAPLFVLLLLPLLAITMRIAFGRQRTVADELVLVLYGYGCGGLLQAVYAPCAWFGAPPDLAGPLPLVWTAWAAVHFHAGRHAAASVLRTLLAHAMWIVLVGSILAAIALLGSALGVIG